MRCLHICQERKPVIQIVDLRIPHFLVVIPSGEQTHLLVSAVGIHTYLHRHEVQTSCAVAPGSLAELHGICHVGGHILTVCFQIAVHGLDDITLDELSKLVGRRQNQIEAIAGSQHDIVLIGVRLDDAELYTDFIRHLLEHMGVRIICHITGKFLCQDGQRHRTAILCGCGTLCCFRSLISCGGLCCTGSTSAAGQQ